MSAFTANIPTNTAPESFQGNSKNSIDSNSIGSLINKLNTADKKAAYPGSTNKKNEQEIKTVMENVLKNPDYYADALLKLPMIYERLVKSQTSSGSGKLNAEHLLHNNITNKSSGSSETQTLKVANNIPLSPEYISNFLNDKTIPGDVKHQMMRDWQDNALKQKQLTAEQELKEAAANKTEEQKRWEEEFGFKLDASEFDRLLRQNQLTLDIGKFKFDRNKYTKEYAENLRDYDLKFMQYQRGVGDKETEIPQYEEETLQNEKNPDINTQNGNSDEKVPVGILDNIKLDVLKLNSMASLAPIKGGDLKYNDIAKPYSEHNGYYYYRDKNTRETYKVDSSTLNGSGILPDGRIIISDREEDPE